MKVRGFFIIFVTSRKWSIILTQEEYHVDKAEHGVRVLGDPVRLPLYAFVDFYISQRCLFFIHDIWVKSCCSGGGPMRAASGYFRAITINTRYHPRMKSRGIVYGW